ncbi:MAG: hypothetical protein L3J43_03910 [Sulfurovum sp.]|nr:hypothetical protein [Sulfurovum sp.]
MKQTFLVRDANAKVTFKGTAVRIVSEQGDRIIGFHQIIHLYLHQDINITVKTAIQIARHVPLHFVDKRAKVLAQIKIGGV